MSYSATGSIDLSNTGNILYLSNHITKLGSNLTIGTSPVSNEQYYFLGNANVTGQLIVGGNLDFYGNLLQNGIPYVSSQWTSSGANLYYNAVDGNVGIGTSDPQYKLDVNGTANISGDLRFTGNLIQNGSPYIASQWTSSGSNIYYNVVDGNVGIANSNPQFTLDVGGNINFSGNLYQNGNLFSGGGGSQWLNGNGSGNIYYLGNVGINNPTPIYAFDIAGDANISSNVYANNFYIRNDCVLQAGDFSILNGNLTVYERFNAFGESELTGNLTVYNADIYNYGNIYTYNGLYINKNGALYTLNENPNQHAFYAYDTVNFMTTLFGGADDTNAVGYIGVGGYGGSLPLILNPLGGNVGIGTSISNTRAKLSVNGNAVITGNLNVGNGNLFMNRFGNLGIWTTNPMANLEIQGNAIINGNLNIQNGNLFMNRFGNLGLWTTNPTANIHVVGNALITGNMSVSNAKFYVADSGNVGINTITPTANIEIQGNAFINGNLMIGNGNLFMNRFGNLGLWTTNPLATLDITGNARISGNLNVDSGTMWVDATNNRLGLGTFTPTVQLDLSTDGARKLTTTTWTTGSDARIKENIVDANLDTCYQIVSNIPLHHYKWIPEIAEKVEDKAMLGWIAQEVEEYFPKAVSKSHEYGLSDFRTLNADQMYKVMYGALQKVMILNHDLANRVSDFDNRTRDFDNRISDLTCQVSNLTIQLSNLSNLFASNTDGSSVDVPNIIVTNMMTSSSNETPIWKSEISKWDSLKW